MLKRIVPFKMLYRYKVGIFTGLVATFTFLLAYVTGPKSTRAPTIRVLYLSFSDHVAVKRLLLLGSSASTYDDSLQILKISEDGTVTIDREEWDLRSASEDEFYQNNILLECTASFATSWKYSGFGGPVVTEKNVRIHGNFNDSSTFTYLSLLNLMPLTEKSTGTYTCFGASNKTSHTSASIHLFVPGETTFLIDYDTTIETAGEDKIFVPCPVTNVSANVSLYFKNQPVSTESIDNLLTFDPKSGFYLTPKFVEEQNEPWGQFYCKNEETKEKSGIITVQPQKGLIVNAIPETKTVFMSKPSRGGTSKNVKEKFKFTCQAKEEITLKFLRVVINPMVQYDFNSSSSFPFSAYSEVNTRHFRNSSKIFCRTLRNNEDLHSWKVLFSSLSQRTELTDFQYDPNREDFSCCSPSNKRAKLTVLNCNSISECRIKSQCLLPGHKCDPDRVETLPERSGCVRHKLQRSSRNSRLRVENDDNSTLESGLLQCTIDGKSINRIFFASKHASENGTKLEIVSDEVSLTSSTNSQFGLDSSTLNVESYLQVMEVGGTSQKPGRKRFMCRGAKFFVAVGFIWQAIYNKNDVKYFFGRDSVKDEWIQSNLELPTKISQHGITSNLKRLYCAAPFWNSKGGWVNVKLEVNVEKHHAA